MILKIRKRDYKMSDADLVQLSDIFKVRGERDLTELGRYNLDAPWLLGLSSKRNVFAITESDVALMADITTATQQRNVARILLEDSIRDIMVFVGLVFDKNSGEYRSFGVGSISGLSENDFARTALGVGTRALLYLTELGAKGYSQDLLDEFEALRIDFDNKIEVKKTMVDKRDIAVDNRIRLGNELYAMVVELGEMGKGYWITRNEAKYNDYIIYKSSAAQPPQFETEGPVPAGSVVNASVSGITASTDITLKNTSDTPLVFFFAQEPTDTVAATMISVALQTQQTLAASAIGYNEATDTTRLNVYNGTPLEGSYSILWE